jgi:prevent-host-death family protein
MQVLARNLMPLTDFKAHAADVMLRLRTDGQPIILTQNGRSAAVLLSPAAFDALVARDRRHIAAGLADLDAGRVVDGDDVAAYAEARIEAAERR